MSSFTLPVHFLSGVFIVTSLIVTSVPRSRMNTSTEGVHLTNPCTKRKVLSLTKPKGKIYKTKNDNIKNPSAIILHMNFQGLLNANIIFVEEQDWWGFFLTQSWGDRRVHAFPKNICPKVSSIAQLEFELAYYDSAVQPLHHEDNPALLYSDCLSVGNPLKRAMIMKSWCERFRVIGVRLRLAYLRIKLH